MCHLLTIAIPTYRRADKLNLQLEWLSRSLLGVESLCQVIVLDNASPDYTPEICERWCKQMTARGIPFRAHRNAQNIGPLPNIARCIEQSESEYTWVMGDDDDVSDGAVHWVVEKLSANPELASIVLNFRAVGKTEYPRCYLLDADLLDEGNQVITQCLRQAYFGLAFTTAQIYRTTAAQAALRAWPAGIANYDYQVFITAFTGLQGKVLASRDPMVSYVTGDNIYERDKRVAMRLYADSVEVFVQLRRIGYPRALCRELAWHHLWFFRKRFVKRALDNNPLLTLATAARVLKSLPFL